MYLQEQEYLKEEPTVFVKNNNHMHRNAITPGLLSVQMLKLNIQNMSQEQIERYLNIIEDSFKKETELIEQQNDQVQTGNILIFRKKKKYQTNGSSDS